jgi:hypothetical protein
MIKLIPVKNKAPPPEYACIYITAPEVAAKAPIEANKGQGLGSTI